jgi:CcmD family protein
MGPWDYVGLAYGIVWGVIVVYWICLKRRYNDAQAELASFESREATIGHVKT